MYSRSEIALLKRGFDRYGIEAVSYDYDDTLCDTNTRFLQSIDDYLTYVRAQFPHLDEAELRSSFTSFNNQALATHSVRSDRWDRVVECLSSKFDLPLGVMAQGLPIFAELYLCAPKLFHGVIETMTVVKQTGRKNIVGSHVLESWHRIKTLEHDTSKLIDDEYLVDPSDKKGPVHWQLLFQKAGVKPQSVIGIGDSVERDIEAMHKVGVPAENLYLVKEKWSEYSRGTLPGGANRIEGIWEVIPALVANFGRRERGGGFEPSMRLDLT